MTAAFTASRNSSAGRSVFLLLLQTQVRHKEPSSRNQVNLKNESAKTHLDIKNMMENSYYDSRKTIYTKSKSSQMITRLLCYHPVSWRKCTIYDLLILSHTMTQKSELRPRVILQASCSRAKHSSGGRVSITLRAVAVIQAGQEGRGAQCPTSWHPHRDTIGCDRREPTPRDREWCEQAAGCNLLCSSELEKYVDIPVMGQQNISDSVVLHRSQYKTELNC